MSSSSLFTNSAFAKISMPCVASISSPPSFSMEQVALLSSNSIFFTFNVRGIPFGVSIFIFSIFSLVKSICTDALDAALAQEPVVYPLLYFFPSI